MLRSSVSISGLSISGLSISGLSISILFGAMLAVSPARATPVAYSTGLANPAVTVAFDGLATDTPIDATYAAQGVTFTDLYATTVLGSTLAPSTPPAAANFLGGTTFPSFTISFAAPVTDAEFFLYTDGFGTTITSALDGTTIETTTATSYDNSNADFFGFTDSLFDSITVSVAGTGRAVIDDVQFNPEAVQEPASGAVLLVGLAGLAMLGRRRRSL